MARKETDDKKEQKRLGDAVNRAFNTCPYCKSSDLDAYDHDGDRTVTFSVRCDSCGAEWKEHYRFTGASDFVRGRV